MKRAKVYRKLLAGGRLTTSDACQVYLYAIQRLLDVATQHPHGSAERYAICASAFRMFGDYDWDGDASLEEIVDSIDRRLDELWRLDDPVPNDT